MVYDLDAPEHEICRGVMKDLKAEASRLRVALATAKRDALREAIALVDRTDISSRTPGEYRSGIETGLCLAVESIVAALKTTKCGSECYDRASGNFTKCNKMVGHPERHTDGCMEWGPLPEPPCKTCGGTRKVWDEGVTGQPMISAPCPACSAPKKS